MQEEYHDVYKIVFLGDSAVGKTNMISNFVSANVAPSTKGPTLGIEYSSKTISVDASHTVKAQIWDTAGQEQYRSVITSHLRKAQGAFVVFDLSNRKTFDNAGYWVRELRQKAVENVVVMLVGNKADKRRQVSRQEAEQWAHRQRISYAQTSAADIRSLNDIFTRLCQHIASGKRSDEESLPRSKSIPLMAGDRVISQEANGGKSRCC